MEVEIMDMLWPLAIVLGTGVALVALYIAGPRLFTGTVTIARAFWCPFRHVNVDVEFDRSAWDGRPVDVRRCSAFTPPTDVGCDKACLGLEEFGALPPCHAESRNETPSAIRE
jgi:hypothetical protein